MTTRWDYDSGEMTVLARMMRGLVDRHGWDYTDFQEMSFLDVEAAYLDVEEDFRPTSV